MARKTYWEGVVCSTDRDREAIRSWFTGMADDLIGPSKASILCRIEDDRELKIAALFTTKDGVARELVRTNGRSITITIRAPTKAPWRRT